jgi:transcriptional regulator with XRE-family HTH domain
MGTIGRHICMEPSKMTSASEKTMPYMSSERRRAKTMQESTLLSGLGARINELATAVGGIKSLADMTGISESQMHRYISGTSEATVSKLAAIAKCGGVSIAWLITGEDAARQERQEQLSPQSSEPVLDMPRLVDAVETVEAGLQAAQRAMQPRPKAELVALVYQALEEEDAPTKLMRLVKDVIARSQQQYEGTT